MKTQYIKLKKWVKKNITNRKFTYAYEVYLPEVAKCIELILKHEKNRLPVIIVSYNNGVYVKNTCDQLAKKNIKPIVIDNASNDEMSIQILEMLNAKNIANVVFSKYNFGHMVGFLDPIYSILPNFFAYTDPDLQFNHNLPVNFLDILEELTEKYRVFKVGFALDYKYRSKLIDNKFRVYRFEPFIYEGIYNVAEWEERFWRFRIENDSLELYSATVDTTFAVYNKLHYHGSFEEAIRIAGDYTCVHLPWYPELDLFSQEQKKIFKENNVSSTWV